MKFKTTPSPQTSGVHLSGYRRLHHRQQRVRIRGVLLILAVLGFPVALSRSDLQQWWGEQERTFDYFALTVSMAMAGICQLAARVLHLKPPGLNKIGQSRRLRLPSNRIPRQTLTAHHSTTNPIYIL